MGPLGVPTLRQVNHFCSVVVECKVFGSKKSRAFYFRRRVNLIWGFKAVFDYILCVVGSYSMNIECLGSIIIKY